MGLVSACETLNGIPGKHNTKRLLVLCRMLSCLLTIRGADRDYILDQLLSSMKAFELYWRKMNPR